MGVGLASLRPTPTFIVPVLPSRGGVLSLPQADRRFGFHREPDARHFAPRPPGHSAHQVDFVTQPRRSCGLVMAETTETPSLPSTLSLQATGMPCLLVHEHAQCAGTTLAGESAECAGSRSRLDRRLLMPTLMRPARLQRIEQPARTWATNEHARRPSHAPPALGMSPTYRFCDDEVTVYSVNRSSPSRP